MREGVLLGIEDEIDVALPMQGDVLGAVGADMREAHRRKHFGEARARLGIDRELDEFEAVTHRRRRGGEHARRRSGVAREFFFQQQQRTHCVDRSRARRRGAEFVVEYFERDRSVVAARQHIAGEAGDRERALSGEQAEMPAPRQWVEPHHRRVGQLGEEDAIARNFRDGRVVVVDCESVERVDHQPDRRMIGRLHNLPRMAEFIDLAPPGERLVPDAEAAPRRTLAERAQVFGGDRVVADRVGRSVAAHQHQVGAELLHHVELGFGAVEVLRHPRAGRGLEVAEGLEQQNAQAEVAADRLHLGGRAVEIEQVVLENLYPVEAGRRDGLQLFDQRAAERHSGDGPKHSGYPIN